MFPYRLLFVKITMQGLHTARLIILSAFLILVTLTKESITLKTTEGAIAAMMIAPCGSPRDRLLARRTFHVRHSLHNRIQQNPSHFLLTRRKRLIEPLIKLASQFHDLFIGQLMTRDILGPLTIKLRHFDVPILI
jgi:hypothetical protein